MILFIKLSELVLSDEKAQKSGRGGAEVFQGPAWSSLFLKLRHRGSDQGRRQGTCGRSPGRWVSLLGSQRGCPRDGWKAFFFVWLCHTARGTLVPDRLNLSLTTGSRKVPGRLFHADTHAKGESLAFASLKELKCSRAGRARAMMRTIPDGIVSHCVLERMEGDLETENRRKQRWGWG